MWGGGREMRFRVVNGGVARGGVVEGREGNWGKRKSATKEAGRLDCFARPMSPTMILIMHYAPKIFQ